MMAIMPSYVLVKNSLIDWQAWGQKLMIDRLGYIKDVTPEEGVSSLNGSKSEYR